MKSELISSQFQSRAVSRVLGITQPQSLVVDSLTFFFFFFFLILLIYLDTQAFGILVPRPGIGLMPPALEAQP